MTYSATYSPSNIYTAGGQTMVQNSLGQWEPYQAPQYGSQTPYYPRDWGSSPYPGPAGTPGSVSPSPQSTYQAQPTTTGGLQQGRQTTTTQNALTTQVQDPRSQALFQLLEDIIAGKREPIDRDRAFSATMDVANSANAQQMSALRDQLAVTGGSLTDPSVMARQAAINQQRQVGAAQAARNISMEADAAKLAAQFHAGGMMQQYDPRRQQYTSTTSVNEMVPADAYSQYQLGSQTARMGVPTVNQQLPVWSWQKPQYAGNMSSVG
jgi:hypothetical protein